ncbi:MAG: PIG-L deacetylase family protein [Pirellulaceae bacterium]|jgi:LmbE family N-acetylglucosaminyl deacetylase|nr:PIG-L deacetylase family protein [Pirellulaceae bacterium]MDP6553429.1 PIG-L deacetylase family protein [Pirellulaceae bacterium]
MINLQIRDLRTILCIGAHADDIEIGCGGAILKLLADHPSAKVVWVVLSADDQREAEARRSAGEFLSDAAESHIVIRHFRDTFFPYDGSEIKEFFRELQGRVAPDVIFTHRREDMHQDHRLVAELTWNTFRNHLILEYEIPKYEGDLGAPNVFYPLDRSVCARKVETIYQEFESQQSRSWFTEETFWSLLRIRGIECEAPTGYAEALYARKLML